MSKHLKSKKNKKIKYRKSRKTRGGVKTPEQIQKEMMANATPMTPYELNRLAEADRIAEERERNDNEIGRINAELERQRINSITSFPTTPMSPEDARRQQEQDALDNALVNSEEAKERKLTVADLGGSKRRHRKGKKAKKSRKIRGGNRIGGNNIGANCNEPNFSIYNTNLLKLFPYKGGSVTPLEGMELLQIPEEERQRLAQEEFADIRLLNRAEAEEARQQLAQEEERQRLDILQNEEDARIQQATRDADIYRISNPVTNTGYEPVVSFMDANLDEGDEGDEGDKGGSKQKNKRKGKKSRKSKKGRKGKKSRKARKSRGGELQADDIYKNSEGSNF
jgi:hypothetical protein